MSRSLEITQPENHEERAAVAGRCIRKLKLTMPVLVDDMKGTAMKAYGGWPDRIAIIGVDGTIRYHSRPGPFGFKPAEAEEVLREILTP